MTINPEAFGSEEQMRQLLAMLMGTTANPGSEAQQQDSQGRLGGRAGGGFDPLVLNRVVPRREAFSRIVGVSEATWDRIERSGDGPPRSQLSERRIGYRVRDLLLWLDARTAKAAA